MTVLTWAGTKASARKLEDDINKTDSAGKTREHQYATVEFEYDEWSNKVDGEKTYGRAFAYVDTLSSTVTMRPGQSITNESGKWELVAEETETP